MRGHKQILSEVEALQSRAALYEYQARLLRESAELLVQDQRSAPVAQSLSFLPDYRGGWEDWQLDPRDRPTIPHALNFSGVYIWHDAGTILYVGESKQIAVRLKDHFPLAPEASVNRFIYRRTQRVIAPPSLWIARVEGINDRLALEAAVIEHGNPIFNVARAGIWRPE